MLTARRTSWSLRTLQEQTIMDGEARWTEQRLDIQDGCGMQKKKTPFQAIPNCKVRAQSAARSGRRAARKCSGFPSSAAPSAAVKTPWPHGPCKFDAAPHLARRLVAMGQPRSLNIQAKYETFDA